MRTSGSMTLPLLELVEPALNVKRYLELPSSSTLCCSDSGSSPRPEGAVSRRDAMCDSFDYQ